MVNHPNRSKQQQAKHTPGPWTLKRGAGRYSDRLYIESHVYSTQTVTSGKDQIAQLTSLYWDDHGQEVEANAFLIAAAPELLAALKALQTWPKQNCWCPLERAQAEAHGTKIHMPSCKAARAATAKAEGR